MAAASTPAWPVNVKLTEDDLVYFERLGDALVRDLIFAYETHSDHSYSKRELMTTKDSLKVYKQQVEHRAYAQDVHVQTSSNLPSLLVTGDIVGQCDDVMFGLLSTDTESMNISGSYYQDGMDVGRVLAVIRMPTTGDPFCFMGIKWHSMSYSKANGVTSFPFVKKRDLLYLECMGWATLNNGKQVGYRIVQSINLESPENSILSSRSTSSVCTKPSIPQWFRQQVIDPLTCRNNSDCTSPFVRAKSAIGQIFHQPSDDQALQVFMLGQYDPCGRIIESVRLKIAANLVLDVVPNALRCAKAKKLSWLAKHGWGRSIDFYFGRGCECCGDRVAITTIFGFPGGCWLCSKTVCHKCRIITTENTLEERFEYSSPSPLDKLIGTHGTQHRQSWQRQADRRMSPKRSSVLIPESNKEICSRRQLVCRPCYDAAEQERAAPMTVEDVDRL